MDEASASGALSQNQKLFLQQQQQQRQQQQQQQMLLLQQFQKQQLQLQQQQQFKHMHQLQQQQAMSRFPSNIDAHLRPPGIRTLQQPKPQPGQQGMPPQQAPATPQQKVPPVAAVPGSAVPTGTVGRQASQVELELAQQDAWMVCNPDIRRPFVSIEDAVHRLLPYHIVADYEAEEDDRILDSDTTGQVPSRLQQWDNNVLAKLAEFTSTFEKQVLAFNIMSRKRALGEFRSEERLMIEQALLQEEKQSLMLWRAQLESREKAEREAAEIKMRMAMAQVEQARAEASTRGPIRASEGSSDDLGEDPGANADEVIPAWGSNSNQRDEDPSEDYLNDENDPENDDAGVQGEWREVGELDLNTR